MTEPPKPPPTDKSWIEMESPTTGGVVPTWLMLLIAVAVVLLILFLIGVQLDVGVH